MTEGDMHERLGEVVGLVPVNMKEAVHRAKELYRMLRRANADEIRPQGVHEAALVLAHVFLNAGRLKTAIRVAKWAMTLDCDFKKEGRHYYLVGSCYLLMRGRENEAAREFAKALKFPEADLEHALPDLCHKAAHAYRDIGEYVRALECCRKLLRLMPNPSSYDDRYSVQSARIVMAHCFWAMGREAEAMDAVETVLKLKDPVHTVRPHAYSTMADIHEYRGEYKAAAEDYRKAIELMEEDIDRPWEGAHRDSEIAKMKSSISRWRFDLRECEIRNRMASRRQK